MVDHRVPVWRYIGYTSHRTVQQFPFRCDVIYTRRCTIIDLTISVYGETAFELAMRICPTCRKEGLEVDKITVANHAKESCWPLGYDKFSFCDNPHCEVIYFTASGRVLDKDDVKTRVTFKERTAPRPLCYCKQVTEEDVVRAIENGANSFDEVRAATGIGGGGQCKVTNPAGRCCSRNYKPFIEKELRKRGRKGSDDNPMVVK
jgi:bacterioferritin-associated ferredoxin